MTTQVLKNASVTLDSVDLSAYCEKVTLTYKSDTADVTAMGDNSHVKLGTLKDWTLSLEFFEDNTAGGPSGTLFAQVGATIPVAILPNGGTVSTTNPSYTGNGVVESLTPVDGSVGTAQKVAVTIQAAGDLSRATA